MITSTNVCFSFSEYFFLVLGKNNFLFLIFCDSVVFKYPRIWLWAQAMIQQSLNTKQSDWRGDNFTIYWVLHIRDNFSYLYSFHLQKDNFIHSQDLKIRLDHMTDVITVILWHFSRVNRTWANLSLSSLISLDSSDIYPSRGSQQGCGQPQPGPSRGL